MKKFKLTIKDSWPDALPRSKSFPFEEEYPIVSETSFKKTHTPSESLLRCVGVVLIILMTTLLGQTWGDPRFSNINLDIPRIQQSIPLIREILSPKL
ncbi:MULTISPECIES: hypothetical protein [unclassified Oceanispirochaeta]|uniref:hypothetical protein n=1 Tax=unclassified Oceanispirochaeta TaxID=2635722 RepID=UPI000E09319A|nr:MULTISPECIES: hypothetical protein [unclassified Oceanispirochaeta]MBF9016312.1 hypothetical protein [Oceanispirochaeta sp. M2]NPD72775.1 hypothetical protein [Oceanispirochaeta sp. M1]RDG31620.1 hypothetical protein DV872_11750 [Oceanispirochaeta sp. M1]